jgi:electron transport complex protein RnfA
MFNASLYAVFLYNFIFSGGLGTTEVIRAAKKNGGMLAFAGLISFFSMLTSAVSRLLTIWIPSFETLSFAWRCLLFGGILLVLYLLTGVALAFLKIRAQVFLLKYLGMAVLNTLVMAIPFLNFQRSHDLPRALAFGLGAGIAFAGASLLINSGMHKLQQNKSIPVMFTGVPATLIYTGLLALAFTGFTGASLFGAEGGI